MRLLRPQGGRLGHGVPEPGRMARVPGQRGQGQALGRDLLIAKAAGGREDAPSCPHTRLGQDHDGCHHKGRHLVRTPPPTSREEALHSCTEGRGVKVRARAQGSWTRRAWQSRCVPLCPTPTGPPGWESRPAQCRLLGGVPRPPVLSLTEQAQGCAGNARPQPSPPRRTQGTTSHTGP